MLGLRSLYWRLFAAEPESLEEFAQLLKSRGVKQVVAKLEVSYLQSMVNVMDSEFRCTICYSIKGWEFRECLFRMSAKGVTPMILKKASVQAYLMAETRLGRLQHLCPNDTLIGFIGPRKVLMDQAELELLHKAAVHLGLITH